MEASCEGAAGLEDMTQHRSKAEATCEGFVERGVVGLEDTTQHTKAKQKRRVKDVLKETLQDLKTGKNNKSKVEATQHTQAKWKRDVKDILKEALQVLKIRHNTQK